MPVSRWSFAIFALCLILPAGAYDPPAGGEALPVLVSPVMMGGGASVASAALPMADAFNPAASAGIQRINLDVSYGALVGLGGETGLGHVFNLGAAFPRDYGVWTTRFGFVHSPFNGLPWGTLFSGRVGMAKELYPELLQVGAAVDVSLGYNTAFGWGLGLDLGVQGTPGDLGFLKDLRWGVVLRNIGKAYSAPGSVGILGTGQPTGYDSAFTLAVGAAADFVQATKPGIAFGGSLDLAGPTFQNLLVNIGLQLSIRDTVFVRSGWDFNLREALAGIKQGLLPSFGISGAFALPATARVGRTKDLVDTAAAAANTAAVAANTAAAAPNGPNGPNGSNGSVMAIDSRDIWPGTVIQPAIGAYQLPGGVWAFSLGVAMAMGTLDSEPPVITVVYPQTEFDLVYISPNGDGIKDSVTVKVSISDRRHIHGYVFKVRDAAGRTMRTMQDHEARPSSGGFNEVMARLMYVNRSVVVPEEFVWDGRTDSGLVVPDGLYTIEIEAYDDNGNQASAGPYSVMVDNTAPVVRAVGPNRKASSIFSPDGDGDKDDFPIVQTGSVEDLWVAEIIDAAGSPVKRWEFRSAAPGGIVWDGRNEAGAIVSDGIYGYRIQATDRAGNRGVARVEPIVVNTQRAPIGVAVDLPAFSPNGDRVLDTLNIVPNVPVRAAMSTWSVAVVDASGRNRWSLSGTGTEGFEEQFLFKGQDNGGAALPEGTYRVRLNVRYDNGHSPEAWSAPFVLDITAPTVTVSGPVGLDAQVFSPDGDGNKDSYTIRQSGSLEDLWVAEILDATGRSMRRWEFRSAAPADIVWDGRSQAGSVVPDGTYLYRIQSTDRAGNRGQARIEGIVVDTRRPVISLMTDLPAFSPNADGVKDILTITAQVPLRGSLSFWALAVVDGSGRNRWTLSGSGSEGFKDQFMFTGRDNDGTLLPEGSYRAKLTLRYINGYNPETWSPSFVLDVTAPSVSVSGPAGAHAFTFSPDGDGKKDSFTITQSGSAEDLWSASLMSEGGSTVRTWEFRNGPPTNIIWDGRTNSGQLATDGRYSYQIIATDQAGNRGGATLQGIVVDTRKPNIGLAIDMPAFSPNGDTIKDVLTITPEISAREAVVGWSLAVVDANGRERWTVSGASQLSMQARYSFAGRDTSGAALPEGSYRSRLSVRYANGYEPLVWSAPFIIDITPPSATVGVDQQAFNPLGDARTSVVISQSGSEEALWQGSIVDRNGTALRTWRFIGRPDPIVRWDGFDNAGKVVPDGTYTYRLTSTDQAGNSFTVGSPSLVVNTEAKDVRLSLDRRAFSPNGDGINDTLTIGPSSAASNISQWKLEIRNLAGTVVRSFTGRSPLPQAIAWDGRTDRNVLAEDGIYRARIQVDYTTGEQQTAISVDVELDTKAPVISLSVPDKLFSPNGDGRKDTLRIMQDSAPGDNWEGRIVDAQNRTVHTWTWKDRAVNFEWDGRDNQGNIVADGTYRYIIWSEDPAGNRTERMVDGITVDNRPTPVSVSASVIGFNPVGDREPKQLTLTPTIALRQGIETWQLELVDQDGAVRRSFGGPGSIAIPAVIDWDGKADSGRIIPGTYRAVLTVDYSKGDRSQASSAAFVLFTRVPTIRVRAEDKLFSPNGDGRKDVVRFIQESEVGDNWEGRIVDDSNRVVKSWTWKERATNFDWDGRDAQGKLVADGSYRYIVWSVDSAGNRFEQSVDGIVVDNRPTPLSVAVSVAGFNPNAAGQAERLSMALTVGLRQGIEAWRLELVDQGGTVRRTFSGPGSTAIPPALDWDGKADNLSVIPGTYTAVFTVDYTKGDRAQASSASFVLYTRVPVIRVRADDKLFSPNGDGRKDVVRFIQDSEPGDDWEGLIMDERNQTIRTWNWKDRATNFEWDGRDAQGRIVADGTYRYVVWSKDAAGKRIEQVVDGLVVDNRPTPVAVSANVTGFNPTVAGPAGRLPLTLTISLRQGIETWRLELVDQGGTVRRTYTGPGTSVIPPVIEWDGKTDTGTILPGAFRAVLTVDYLKGDRAQASSAGVILFTRFPTIRASVTDKLFSPNGDGRKDVLRFVQDSEPGDDWEGRIVDARNQTVRTWTWKGRATSFEWDGRDAQGRVVPDGTYRYIVWSDDPTGKRTEVAIDGIIVDNRPTVVSVTAGSAGFNPAATGQAGRMPVTLTVGLKEGIEAWRLEFVDQDGTIQRTIRGTGTTAIPPTIDWDGKTDNGSIVTGTYRAALTVDYLKGDRAQATSGGFSVFIRVPTIRVSVADKLFSPNGDGRKDVLRFSQTSEPGDDWDGRIVDSQNRTVRTWTWKGQAANFEWDGRDAQGKVVADGNYRYIVSAVDPTGKRIEQSIDDIIVDNRPTVVSVTASARAFSPNGDGVSDMIALAPTISLRQGIEAWRLELVDQGGTVRRTFRGAGTTAIPSVIDWDGKTDSGGIVQGTYRAMLTVDYFKGDRAQASSAGFVLDSQGPQVTINVTPKLFSPDGDGVDDELYVSLRVIDASAIDAWRFEIIEVAVVEGAGPTRERLFFSWNGRGAPPERLIWDGRSPRGELVEAATDYVYRFHVSDEWNNSTVVEGTIAVDVLVIRDGDRLKIKVPSIVFRSNFADFNDLPKDTVDRNSEVLLRIAQILNRFRDYRIQIEGHANSVAKMTGASQAAVTREEQNELLPLSTARAEAVRQKLVEFGVDAQRLTVVGRGSSEPVVSFSDAENRWKNRRVEFILIRQ
jgi:flagellar hook assembly protein FlgD/flagellar motor protein MotB